MALEAKGAECRVAATGHDGVSGLASALPDCILCDLGLPDGSGLDWLAKFRAAPGAANLPAIATSGYGRSSDRAKSLAAGFEKHLVKPIYMADLVNAISILTSRSGPLALKSTLARVAEATGCRYTSLFRFEQNELVSVWTFDRSDDAVDSFPLQTPIDASYCVLVKEARTVVVIENALTDQRAANHPKQHDLATYVGAPIFSADGTMFGTLCSYDAAPRSINDQAKATLTEAAQVLERALRESA